MTETILDLDTHIFQQLLEVLILQPLGTHTIAKGKATPTTYFGFAMPKARLSPTVRAAMPKARLTPTVQARGTPTC
jgi:hypothetical protein